MKTKDFDYYLPEELIAQTPLEKRDESRLMCLDKETGELSHHHFYELPDFLNPGDCLILNNSRVLPARLLGQRLPGGGACEVLLLIDRGDKTWECIVRPGKHLRKGTKMQFGNGELKAEVVDVLPDGNRMVKFDFEGIFLEVLEHLGKMPLPPYIKEELQDQERYQTVYSKVNGSAAAPTAGLHFTPELLEKIQAKGVNIGYVTLHVGNSGVGKSTLAGTVEPGLDIRTGDISESHHKGRHTTTFSTMYPLSSGGYLIDTPGIKGFGLIDIADAELWHYFPEMMRLAPQCRFYNCTHVHEPGCAVREAVERGEISWQRYESYLKMLDDDDKYRK